MSRTPAQSRGDGTVRSVPHAKRNPRSQQRLNPAISRSVELSAQSSSGRRFSLGVHTRPNRANARANQLPSVGGAPSEPASQVARYLHTYGHTPPGRFVNRAPSARTPAPSHISSERDPSPTRPPSAANVGRSSLHHERHLPRRRGRGTGIVARNDVRRVQRPVAEPGRTRADVDVFAVHEIGLVEAADAVPELRVDEHHRARYGTHLADRSRDPSHRSTRDRTADFAGTPRRGRTRSMRIPRASAGSSRTADRTSPRRLPLGRHRSRARGARRRTRRRRRGHRARAPRRS